MEIGIFAALVACLSSAACVYVLMEYRMSGERDQALNHLMRAQAQVVTAQKELFGYTAYTQHLVTAKPALAEKMKLSPITVVREYSDIQRLETAHSKQRVPSTALIHYAVEFSLGFDWRMESFDIVQASRNMATTVELQMTKPIVLSPPQIHLQQPHDASAQETPHDNLELSPELQTKLLASALQQGVRVVSEEAVLALCALKLAEALRNILLAQPDVQQLPNITVKYNKASLPTFVASSESTDEHGFQQ